MSNKELVFSVTAEDCEWDYFKVGGNGGQKVNKTSSGVRVTHRASGAIGKATDSRSQLANRRTAFKRMVATTEFRIWTQRRLADGPTPEERVEEDMQPHNLKVEVRNGGKWVENESVRV